MLTLLLADDEKITRQGICHTIPWGELGIGRVLQASNGREALALMRQNTPDILLTDVKMPLLDGIALSKQVRLDHPETRIIFISGYADVEYLKAAVQEQAVDYILKPIDQNELYDAVSRAASALRGQREHQRRQNEMKYLIKKSLPSYRKDFFSRLLASDSDLEALREQFALCDFSFSESGSFTAALVSLQYEKDAGVSETAFLATEVEELLADYVKRYAAGYVYRNNNTLFTLVLSSPEYGEVPAEFYSGLIAALNARLPVVCSVGVGSVCTSLYDIGESCQCAETALARQFHDGMGEVYFSGEAGVGEAPFFPSSGQWADQLCTAVLSQSRERCRAVIQAVTKELNRLDFVNMNYVYHYCLLFISTVLSRLCVEENRVTVTHLDLLVRSQAILPTCKTAYDIQQFFHSVLDDLLLMFSKEPQTQSQLAVRSVVSYLEEHYQDNITIQEISRKLYITPAYLCRLFKRETSKTINEYLTELRIKKAKELLELCQYHLYDIAPMVGYQDIKYFSRIFKAHTGLTPSDYMGIYRK